MTWPLDNEKVAKTILPQCESGHHPTCPKYLVNKKTDEVDIECSCPCGHMGATSVTPSRPKGL